MSGFVATSISIEQAADMIEQQGLTKQVKIGDMMISWLKPEEGLDMLMVQASGSEVALLQPT